MKRLLRILLGQKVTSEDELRAIANKFYIQGAVDFDNYQGGKDVYSFDKCWGELKNELTSKV